MSPKVPILFWILLALPIALYLFWVLQVARRRTVWIRFKMRRSFVGLFLYLAGVFVWLEMGHRPFDSIVVGFLLGVAGGFFFVRPPPQSRRIPSAVKRAVIARDLKGERFNPKIHHIHHIVPFSKGGDNSLRNLKVIRKDENLERGAKMPRLRDLL